MEIILNNLSDTKLKYDLSLTKGDYIATCVQFPYQAAMKTMEELAELSQTVSKCMLNPTDKNKQHFAEEAIDVLLQLQVSIEQFGITDDMLYEWYVAKTKRLRERAKTNEVYQKKARQEAFSYLQNHSLLIQQVMVPDADFDQDNYKITGDIENIDTYRRAINAAIGVDEDSLKDAEIDPEDPNFEQKFRDKLRRRFSKFDYRNVGESRLTNFIAEDIKVFANEFQQAFANPSLPYNALAIEVLVNVFEDYIHDYAVFCTAESMSVTQLMRLVSGVEILLMLNEQNRKIDAISASAYYKNRDKGVSILNALLQFLQNGLPKWFFEDPRTFTMITVLKNSIIQMQKEYK